MQGTDVTAKPICPERARPAKESLQAIINKATKFQGSNVLHNAQDAAEMQWRAEAAENSMEGAMRVPCEGAAENAAGHKCMFHI